MSAGGKVPLGHDRYHQFALRERVHNALGLGRRTALHSQPPRFCRIGDQGVVGTALAAPAAIFIGPFRHFNGVYNVACQGGHHNGHGGGAAAVATDVVCAIGLVGPAFIQLVEVDDLRGAVGKADISKRSNRGTAVLRVLEHSVTQEQAEVLGVIIRQDLLIICQVKDRISEITLSIVGEGVDVPDFLLCLHHILGLGIIVLHRARLIGASVRIETALTLSEYSLHVCQGDGIPALALGSAVLGDKRIDVAGHIAGVRIDDFVVVTARRGKILSDPGLCVSDTLAQNLIDGKGDVIGVLDDGGVVVEDRLAGAAAAGQATENQGGQHEDEQHWDHEQGKGCGEKFLAMLCGVQCGSRYRAVGPAHHRAFCGSGDGLAGFDSPVDSLSSAGRLGQTAFFILVQFGYPLSCVLVLILL